MVRRQRLGVVHVEAGARDRPVPQRGDQGGLVHDRPARRVDQDRGRAHPRQLGRPDQAARAVAEPHMDRHHVGAAEQLVAVRPARRPAPAPAPRRGSGSRRGRASRTPGRPSPPGCPAARARSRRASGPPARCRPSPASRPPAGARPRRGRGAAPPGSAPTSARRPGSAAPPVPHTTTPRAAAAARSIDAFAMPVVTSRRSRGRRSSSSASNGVRSRIATIASNGASRAASASLPATWSEKNVTSASRASHGPNDRATSW